MGICETNDTWKNKFEETKKMPQPFNAPIRPINNFNNYTLSTLSQTDIMSFKFNNQSKPTGIYKYKSKYGKKDGMTTLLSESLYNSFADNKIRNTREITSIEENMNESTSQVFEIISNGRVDKDKVILSTDETTLDNYIEYINNNEPDIKKSKFDINNIYNKKKQKKKNNDNV